MKEAPRWLDVGSVTQPYLSILPDRGKGGGVLDLNIPLLRGQKS